MGVAQLPLEGEGCAGFFRNIELGTMGGIWWKQWLRMVFMQLLFLLRCSAGACSLHVSWIPTSNRRMIH